MVKKTKLNFLIEKFTNDILLESSKVKPTIMYHGTSSKIIPKIFQLGVIPNPSKGKWKNSDKEDSAASPSLQSLEGSYWTDNILTAFGAARNATEVLGGERTIIIAQLVQKSAVPDEDDIRPVVQRTLLDTLSHNLKTKGTVERMSLAAKGKIDADNSHKKELVHKFGELLHDNLKTNEKMPIDFEMAEYVFDAALRRILSYADIKSSADRYAYLDSFEYWLSKKFDWEKAKDLTKKQASEKNFLNFNKSKSEEQFLSALDKVSRRYKKHALPPGGSENFRFQTNLRILEPVGFKGRNKIIAIIAGDKNDLKLIYGNPPQKFIKDWSRSWSPKFRITDKRTGKEIHNTMNEDIDIEKFLTEKMALKSYGSFCQKVADAYDELPEYEPEAVSSYKSLISHVEKMYKQMLSKVKVEFVPGQPYNSQKEMAEKVKETGVLEISKDHNEHSVFSPEQNMKFRAVHDYIVHILSNVNFSDKGEVAAFNAHARLLPQKAIPAAFTEIVGQACYYHTKGSFPKQKIAIMKNFDFKNVGKIKGHDIKNKELVESALKASKTLKAEDVSKLPVGSIVWPVADGRLDGQTWIVNHGGVILPVPVLPERADGIFPDDGENPNSIAEKFALVALGKGKLVTHKTAEKVSLKYYDSKLPG